MISENAARAAHRGDGGDPLECDRRGAAIEKTDNPTATTAQESRVVIASWRRNQRETVQVALDSWRGCPTIDVRTWYLAADNSLRPSKTGISLSVRHLPALAEALTDALIEAERRGLLPDEGGAA
jgi:Transcriptional Coactivator p15 (PC4)